MNKENVEEIRTNNNDDDDDNNNDNSRGKWGQLRQGYSETSLAEGNPIGNP